MKKIKVTATNGQVKTIDVVKWVITEGMLVYETILTNKYSIRLIDLVAVESV